jgi:dipeptidyl aminopeptidase/acylaminoacyl peptidase
MSPTSTPRSTRRSYGHRLLWMGLVTLMTAVLPAPARGEVAAEGRTITIDAWLTLDPVAVPLPAFHAEGDSVEVKDLLDASQLSWDELWPAKGNDLAWPGQPQRTWREEEVEGDPLRLGDLEEDVPQMTLAAAYVAVDRFTHAKLRVKSPHLLRVFLDGKKCCEKLLADAPTGDLEENDGAAEEDADFVGEISAELDLVQGKHLILVQALSDPAGPIDWTLSATLTLDGAQGGAAVETGARDVHALRLSDLLDVDTVREIMLSADGTLLAVQMRYPMPPADFSRSWVDIRETREGAVVHSFRGVGSLSSFQWGPDPKRHRFAFVETDEGKSTLWVGDMDGGPTRALLRDVEHFDGLRWVPDGQSIVYGIAVEPEEKEKGIKRYLGLPDRWPTFRTKTQLHQVSVVDGATRRLTAGPRTNSLEDIAPGGDRLLTTRTVYLDSEWPFEKTQLYELDLTTLQATLVREVHGTLRAQYSPDGKRVLITASPTAFGDIGTNVAGDRIPNEYDTQAYILDLASGDVQAITRGFDPSIDQTAWSAKDDSILLRAAVGSTERIFRYDAKKRAFERLEMPIDVVDAMTLSADGEMLAFYGTGLNTPQRVFAMPVKRKARSKLLWAPLAERFESIETGLVEDFDFTKADGTTITGRVYTPPDFDPGTTYPAIVYYYGGTLPVDRSFGGRYPKELWAAFGYVVYVLQPSGATGFGQDFSARHVNDWGKTVSGEIVEGTQKLLAAHPFIDPARVGCIGASYGGFMTDLLITETPVFAAAVSHAGISSLSSYWGEGYWGYLYSAAATAHSYPWNRPDLYVDQSALFHADRIETPLLLLHGGADPNVPPGESEQMYTALRVLGKDVEFVRIAGEQHWILDYPKRKVWHETILAYFDWKLKGQPAWWDHLYPDEGK